MPISAGTRFGHYEIANPIGSGGMGEVYRARDTNLKREVALKVLPPDFANDADRLTRFQREAEMLASLNHPNIAQIYGLERSDGTTALAMELVEGSTLAERIAQGRLPVEEALRVAAQIADALEAAHERGIVHRDLKPANIVLQPGGTAKVLDFGIAKALDTRATGPGPAALTTPAMTEAGFVLGTAAYMSPEQAKGKRVDERTDIWAFGCVLYEMLTGRAAFLDEDVTSTLARVLEGRADWSALPRAVSPAVRRTLELCFEKDARKRIADMRDVKLAIAGAFEHGERVLPLWRRALPGAAALVIGAVLAGAYVASLRPTAAPVEAETPRTVSRFVITPPAAAPLVNAPDLDLAISPDGQRIAYWSRKPATGNLELYVRELDALEARPIPGTDRPFEPAARNLFFSSDGRSIGYGTPGGDVIGVTIDGRPPTRIIAGVAPTFLGASWGADGTLIFSSLLRLERISVASGAAPEPLLPARQQGGIAGPVLLPGGRAVLFHAFDDDAGDRVAVLDLDTGQEKTIVEDGSNPAYLDTGHLVFARGNTLMAVPFDASELAVTGDTVALVQGIRRTPGGAADYALSANGTLVYVPVAEQLQGAAVLWVDRTGQVQSRAIPDLVENPRDPRLSPDNQRLLLVTGGQADGDLWSYDLGGRPPIPLALPSNNRSPVWSPDGRRVAYIAIADDATLGSVAILAADGSERTPQFIDMRPRAAVTASIGEWSRAGELIFTRLGGDVVAMPIAPAGDTRTIVASDAAEFDAALSPDGGWLAYVSNRTGRAEIWVQPYPEGVPVRVSGGGGMEPAWSADGREIFYRQGDTVMAVAVETGTGFSFTPPRALFSGPYLQPLAQLSRSYAVARDGRFLMIQPDNESAAGTPDSIVVVQNFGEELKQRVRPSAR